MTARDKPLLDALAELREATVEFRDLTSGINDAILIQHADYFVRTAIKVLDVNKPELSPTIADNLSDLLTALQALQIPAQDPHIGRTQSLRQLRAGKGLILTALSDALKGAEALGLKPHQTPIPEELAIQVPKASIAALLDGISRRLTQVEESLRTLSRENAANPGPPQQNALISFYVDKMQVEASLMRVHIKVGGSYVDIGALARLNETMAELAGDFVATIESWRKRIAAKLVALAVSSVRSVTRVSSGLRTIVASMLTQSRSRATNEQNISRSDKTHAIGLVGIMPFYSRNVERILSSEGYRVSTFPSAFAAFAEDSRELDCFIVDIESDGMRHLDLQYELQRLTDVPVIATATHGDTDLVVKAMRAGAVDFLEIPFSSSDLLYSVERALDIMTELKSRKAEAEAAQELLSLLSTRERDVLDQLVSGRSNKVAAYELGISPRTIEIHRARIMNKLNARSLPDLVRIALAARLNTRQTPGSDV